MGKFLVLFVSFVSLQSFAGPEEHIANQICYNLVTVAGEYVPNTIPKSVCIEKVTVDTDKSQIYIESYFQQNLFNGMKLFSLVRKNEDFYNFYGNNTLFNKWDTGCGDGETVELKVMGLVDNYGAVDVSALNVQALRVFSNDTCHSQPWSTEYQYRP